MLCPQGTDATPTYPYDAVGKACHRVGARSHRPRHQRARRKVLYYLADPRRPGVVVAVRGPDVQHCPAALKSAATLATAAAFCLGADRPDDPLPELCPDFAETSECPNAGGCPRVHAARCTDLRPHRRAPDHSGNGSPPPGATYAPSVWPFFVAPHNTDPHRITSTVDPTECFITKAVDPSGAVAAATPQRPLEHCAHFVLKGLCLFGADCGFVHHAPRPAGPAEENTPAAFRTPTARALPALAASDHDGNTAAGPSTAPQPQRASLLQGMSPAAPEASSPIPPAHRRVWHNPYGRAPGWREQ